MHLLTLLSKLTNYNNRKYEVDCPQLGLFISAGSKVEAIKKMASELNMFFEIADVKILSSQKFDDKTIHNIKLTVAR